MKLLLAAIAMFTAVASAQQPGDDPIGRYLVPPELVMQHSAQLGLTDKQRTTIKNEIQKTQAKFLEVQWDLQEESGRMSQLLQQTPVDEAKVLETADKVMALEREMKRAQLGLLVRIKNSLTAEQIAKIESLRKSK